MSRHGRYDDSWGDEDDMVREDRFVHWSSGDGRIFFPAAKTVKALTPGVYEVKRSNQGIFFEKIPVRTEGLIRLPDTTSGGVITEIQKFWDREAVFVEYGLNYKRGILLYGPPGSGKSCTIQLVMEDVVAREGVVVRFTDPYLFLDGMRSLRQIQKDTPVVVIMEDIDSTLEMYDESEVLNLLDGVNEVRKVVFLATTNYPDKLGARITNRPSRFDKRFRIGYPSEQSRRLYFEHVIGRGDKDRLAAKIAELKLDLDQWVKDTDEFSIAHLKELFVAVVILGDDYKDAIETLRSMKEDVDDDEAEPIGFASGGKAEDFYD